jgi:hypothetical protein
LDSVHSVAKFTDFVAKEISMRRQRMLPEMLAELEGRVAFHREQEAVHGAQEVLHREERSRHGAALAEALQQLEALRTAAEAAEAFLREAPPLPVSSPPAPAPDLHLASRMVALVVEEWPAEGTFGPTSVAAEVNRRFAGQLRKPVAASTVSAYLRRLCKAGTIQALRRGVSHAEALYAKAPPI